MREWFSKLVFFTEPLNHSSTADGLIHISWPAPSTQIIVRNVWKRSSALPFYNWTVMSQDSKKMKSLEE